MMPGNKNKQLLIKILLTGLLIVSLIYFFHPDTGHFSIVINGQPIAEPLVRLAAIPTILAILFFTGILMILAFIGAGFIIFLAVFLFFMMGLFFVAPFSWPFLVIIFLMIMFMSFDDKRKY